MPSNDPYRKLKTSMCGSTEVILSILPLIAGVEPIIDVPIYLYGFADGFPRVRAERGVSERIYGSVVSSYKHLMKR